jgi:hypothetical protein
MLQALQKRPLALNPSVLSKGPPNHYSSKFSELYPLFYLMIGHFTINGLYLVSKGGVLGNWGLFKDRHKIWTCQVWRTRVVMLLALAFRTQLYLALEVSLFSVKIITPNSVSTKWPQQVASKNKNDSSRKHFISNTFTTKDKVHIFQRTIRSAKRKDFWKDLPGKDPAKGPQELIAPAPGYSLFLSPRIVRVWSSLVPFWLISWHGSY